MRILFSGVLLIFFLVVQIAIATDDGAEDNSLQSSQQVVRKSIINHYADLALAQYQDALHTALQLQGAVQTLLKQPTQAHLQQARSAWKQARVPYMQTEVFRFGNAVVDEWEGKVNAWPLDEGLIDYVAPAYGKTSADNPFYTANVIANKRLKLGGRTLDVRRIDSQLLAEKLHEADGIEANVATGYHAIEFLLWGQDLNGTGPGAGARPASDFDVKKCSQPVCARRAAYLSSVTQLLIDDLRWMVSQWQAQGAARQALLADVDKGIASIFTGMGSLSYGELAGERTKLALMLNDPEEEQDCFSDNTHYAHYYNVRGIENVYLGRYETVSGEKLQGPAVSDLLAAADETLDKRIKKRLQHSLASAQAIVDSAEENNVAFDQLIAKDNIEGNALVQNLVDDLLQQTQAIQDAVDFFQLTAVSFQGSDVLTPSSEKPAASPAHQVFQ